MNKFINFRNTNDVSLTSSQLYDQHTFFPAFITDANKALESIIIESPYITYRRLKKLYPVFQLAIDRGVKIIVNTRDPLYHDGGKRDQAAAGILALQNQGVTVLYTSNLHRKLVIIDEQIIYEGSLNILLQSDSCEIMRRIESRQITHQLIEFADLRKWYTL